MLCMCVTNGAITNATRVDDVVATRIERDSISRSRKGLNFGNPSGSRLILTEVEFYWQKQQNCVLCHPMVGLRGNVHGSPMACWKVRGQLSVTSNCNFFSPALTVEEL